MITEYTDQIAFILTLHQDRFVTNYNEQLNIDQLMIES